MLIAEKTNSKDLFKEIRDEHEIARLGEGFANNTEKVILPQAIERATNILKRYSELITQHDVSKVFAVGTSALREAKNGTEVKKELENTLGHEIQLIPGELEAELSFLGAVSSEKSSVVIDIGGGSSEVIKVANGKIIDKISFPVGAVKLTEQYFKPHPISYNNLIKAELFLDEIFEKLTFEANDSDVIAVAGTPTTLAAVDLGLADFERTVIEGHKLKIETINRLFDLFTSVSIDEIIEKHKVHPNRADVISAGTLILLKVLEHINSESCLASTKGIRYGMMKYLISNNL
jgi:exopolyphosphatase/guanosine-5'-triphosphate,3'-diphosphate pyrophosphatase